MKIKKAKIKTEQQTRKDMLYLAKHQGCDMELRQIFERYDKMLKNNPDPVSQKQISVMGAVEVHRLLNVRGGLAVIQMHDDEVIGGEQIIPHDESLDKDD